MRQNKTKRKITKIDIDKTRNITKINEN